MKKVEDFLNKNGLYIFILSFCFLGVLIYVSEASSNVPIMDYWRYLDVLVEKMYTGGVSFSDIYNVNGVHRSVYQILLFLLNIKLFHWNTQISMYLAPVVMMLSSIIFRKYIFEVNPEGKSVYKDILSIIVTLMIFSLGPYEIVSQEFSLSFSLRILIFIIVSIVTNNYLRKMPCNFSQSVFGLSLLYITEIVFIGGAYSVGLMITIIVIIVFDMLQKFRRKIKISFANYCTLLMGILLGLVLYFYGLQISGGSNSTSINIIQMAIDFVKGLIVVCGTSVLGSGGDLEYIFVSGIIMLVVHAFFLFIYCSKKLYEKTYIPAIMYIYFCAFYGMIFLGRASYGINYLTSSRYMTDSIFVIWADIIVLSLIIDKVTNIRTKITVACILIGMVSSVIFIDAKELMIAKYRKIYCDNLIEMMHNIESYSDEELAPFQATSPEMVRRGVKIMQKYELGVYSK